ncbi:MAG: DUF2141 domain-containing protein [Gammaproteobacteria bacterium]|nr:DUF2141 domain-containing protein [Gammaproteobacteria bacterium]
MKTYKAILIIIMPFLFMNYSSAEDLEISLTGFENNNGAAIVVLHKNKDTFPENIEKAFLTISSKITGLTAKIIFRDISSGTYAVAAIHDQNNNKILDKNFFGIPNEGVAVSGNTEVSSGPPSFEDAKFILKEDSAITLKMDY